MTASWKWNTNTQKKKDNSYEAYELEYVYRPENKVLETQFESWNKKIKKTKKMFLWEQKTKFLIIRFESGKKERKKENNSLGFRKKKNFWKTDLKFQKTKLFEIWIESEKKTSTPWRWGNKTLQTDFRNLSAKEFKLEEFNNFK